jgi:hypothetical protein
MNQIKKIPAALEKPGSNAVALPTTAAKFGAASAAGPVAPAPVEEVFAVKNLPADPAH